MKNILLQIYRVQQGAEEKKYLDLADSYILQIMREWRNISLVFTGKLQ